VAAPCPGTPRPAGQPSKIPLRVTRCLSPTLGNQGQERCFRGKWSRGWAGAWAGRRAPSPAARGSLPSSPLAVLGPRCPSPRAVHPPCSPSSPSSHRKALVPLTTAHPSSPLPGPADPREQPRAEPAQTLAGSTYCGCERVSSREPFWAWHGGTDAPPVSTTAAPHERQTSPTGTHLEEPRALLSEGQRSSAILQCLAQDPWRLARRSRGWVGP